MNVNETLKDLAKKGCHPSLFRRGYLWRACVNNIGNDSYWVDASTPRQALMEAVQLWKAAGEPTT